MVEGLRKVFLEDQKMINRLGVRRVDIEYPEDAIDWPGLFVQFRPSSVSWTGINPDGFTLNDSSTEYTKFRRGSFEGYFDLSILALSSQERDRLWDSLVELFLFGRDSPATAPFFDTVNSHDLVALTILETAVEPLGDQSSLGTPWDPNILTYEASLRVNVVGQFWADVYNQKLLPLSAITVRPYVEGQEVFPPNDDQGIWKGLGDPS